MGDRVLVASCAGTLFSLDRDTGDVGWTFDVTASGSKQFHCEMLVADGRVVIGVDTGRGYGHAVDLATGDALWSRSCGTALASDLRAVGDTVVGVATLEDRDELFRADLDDGTTLWTATHPRPPKIGNRRAPVVVDGLIYYGTGDGNVVAHAPDDGRVVRTVAIGAPVATSLAADGQALYGATREGRMFRVDRTTHAVDATLVVGGKPVGAPAIHDGAVAMLIDWRSPDSRLVVVDHDLTSILWEWSPEDRDDHGTIARLARRGDALVIATRRGRVLALDAADGTPIWSYRVPEAIRSVSFDGDVMYVGTIPGMIYAVRLGAAALDGR